eukprot:SAG11_NODE_1960_length_3998_cov_3.835599_4_plen_326_part_00
MQAGQIKAEQMVDSIHTGHHPYYWVRTSFVSSLHCEGPWRRMLTLRLLTALWSTYRSAVAECLAVWQGGGAAGLARHLFEEVSRSETNAKQQSQNRAMMEGGDLNDWLGNTLDITDRIHMRCASFYMGQGDNSDKAGFMQSIAEFLPNGTFLQPPGHVHAMVAKTWQPNGLATTLSGIDNSPDLWGSRWNKTVAASASASDDGKAVTIRLHSNRTTALTVQINLKSKHAPELSLDAADAVASMLAAPSLSYGGAATSDGAQRSGWRAGASDVAALLRDADGAPEQEMKGCHELVFILYSNSIRRLRPLRLNAPCRPPRRCLGGRR